MDTLDALPETTFPLALAIMIHPMGESGATRVGRALKLSNDDRKRCEWLVAHAGALREAATRPKSELYPLLAHPGGRELVAWHRADPRTSDGANFCERVLREMPRAVLDPPTLLTGNDLKKLGLKPGPKFKQFLDAIRAKQYDGELTSKEQAIQFVRGEIDPTPTTDQPPPGG